MANNVNNTASHIQTPHVDRPENNNTKDLVSHPKQTTQITKDQQENEQITGNIFYPFSTERPIPTKIYTTSAPTYYEYKTRPKYIHTKLSLRQIHKLDDEYESLRKHDTISPADQQRLNEINTITERWEQQDTHIPKRRNYQTMEPQQTPQRPTQSQQHHEQRQFISYGQWT